ncbi:unnamed protein product [Sphenostylis stenocarpa]|uniref:Uncharacterized protein n=1 Tax=Sphenostylis stenocarpa TaxID=92480 RepID=A0AA86RMU2_9FABA|nr:unnamed protein product [Sphenostylis stenocarpa]
MRFGNPSLLRDSPHQYGIDSTKNLKKNRMLEYNSLTDCYLFKAIGKIIQERERNRQFSKLAHFGTTVRLGLGRPSQMAKLHRLGPPGTGTAVPLFRGLGRPSQLRTRVPTGWSKLGRPSHLWDGRLDCSAGLRVSGLREAFLACFGRRLMPICVC